MNVQTLTQRYQQEIIAELELTLKGRTVPLYDMLRYHLGWIDQSGKTVEGMTGKGIRPNLCLLACAAVGGQIQAAIPAAAAIELVHNFSLIHDDIEDKSPQRRHRPTLWSVWGVSQAVNAGDSMYTLARLVLYRLEELGVPERKILRIARALDEACIKLCEGQYLD
ncbi:MAG: polyprenyl synthetase family protein, partial [Dehalococcoidia bacterium]|nr:polyprenyl synthetase family protein [Dehalococcoidia bacterium]